MKRDKKREIQCEGCSSVWELDSSFINFISAKLKQCPICWDEKERQ